MRCLSTNTNPFCWSKSITDSCPQCKTLETENQVLNNCSIAAMQGRYTWRHNAVLRQLAFMLQAALPPGDKLYVDLPGYHDPNEIFNSIRPDISVLHNNKLFILELTCCYEKNFEASKMYKLQKYTNAALHVKNNIPTEVCTIEISSLGFVNDSSVNKFCKCLNIPALSQYNIRRLGEISLRCSYFIFCCRHKPWPSDVTDPVVF